MIFLGAFLVELLVLFFLSRAVSQGLSQLFYRMTKNLKATVNLLAVLFLPGTFLHEMAHLLMALALFVKVGKLELIPKLEGNGKVKMGSVQIAQVDLVRSLIVGVAPIILGITVLFFSFHFVTSKILLGYIVFEIGNTMFSSSRDVEGGIKILIFLILIFGIAYLLGFRPTVESLDSMLSARQVEIVKTGDVFLLIPLGIDTLLLLLLGIFL